MNKRVNEVVCIHQCGVNVRVGFRGEGAKRRASHQGNGGYHFVQESQVHSCRLPPTLPSSHPAWHGQLWGALVAGDDGELAVGTGPPEAHTQYPSEQGGRGRKRQKSGGNGEGGRGIKKKQGIKKNIKKVKGEEL